MSDPYTRDTEAQGKRLLYVVRNQNGYYDVQSRGPRGFDWRDEVGPYATYEEADAARRSREDRPAAAQ